MTSPKEKISQLEKELREKNKEIEKLSKMVSYDTLTGILNRVGFKKQIKPFVETMRKEYFLKRRGIKRHLFINNISVVFIDLNNFKKINDLYGHEEGDRLLVEVGKFLSEDIRELDIVCRWSGDEFIVALIDSDKNQSRKKVEEIRNDLNKYFEKYNQNKKIKISASFGVASFFNKERKEPWIFILNHIIKEADTDMYKEKKEQKSLVKRLTRSLREFNLSRSSK